MQKNNQIPTLRKHAVEIFHAGLKAVNPVDAVKKNCYKLENRLVIGDTVYDLTAFEEIVVVGAGKASAFMAHALEEILGDRITAGIINVKHNHTLPLSRIKLVAADHPIPSENGVSGTVEMVTLLEKAYERTLVLCLISGGASALMPLPVETITLADKQNATQQLLSCGANIHDINTIRKHLSGIKGGQLCRVAFPAVVVSMILSDVVGDDLDVIGSGPTVPDTSTFSECLDILNRYNLSEALPSTVVRRIRAGVVGRVEETPKKDDPVFRRSHHVVVGNNFQAIQAAGKKAETLGFHVLILSSMIQGETREVAGVHAAIAREIAKSGNPISCPACIISGGETTVTIKGNGLGGRNQEFALAASLGIVGTENIVFLSGGTDGTDGPTDAAGAVADSYTVSHAEAAGLDPELALNNNNAYPFFKALGDLFITGPTGTNVMDLRICIVG